MRSRRSKASGIVRSILDLRTCNVLLRTETWTKTFNKAQISDLLWFRAAGAVDNKTGHSPAKGIVHARDRLSLLLAEVTQQAQEFLRRRVICVLLCARDGQNAKNRTHMLAI